MQRSKIRQEIEAAMVQVGIDAIECGDDPMRAIQRAFPGTPIAIAAEMEAYSHDAMCERWWASVEKTIDAETMKRAIAKGITD